MHLLCQQLEDHTLLKLCALTFVNSVQTTNFMFVKKMGIFEYWIFFAHFIWYCKKFILITSNKLLDLTRTLLISREYVSVVLPFSITAEIVTYTFCNKQLMTLSKLMPQMQKNKILRGNWTFPSMSWFSHQVELYPCTLNPFVPAFSKKHSDRHTTVCSNTWLTATLKESTHINLILKSEHALNGKPFNVQRYL